MAHTIILLYKESEMSRTYMFPRLKSLLLLLQIVLIFSLQYVAWSEGVEGQPWSERQAIWLSMIGEKSMAFNRDGYEAYSRKNYGAAVEAFGKAIQENFKNCFAHFNTACTLSLMYGSGEKDAAVYGQIYLHLVYAVGMETHYLEKSFTDTDLDPIRKEPPSGEQTVLLAYDKSPDLIFDFYGNGEIYMFATESNASKPAQVSRDTADSITGRWGRFTILGNNVLTFIPGMEDYLIEKYPEVYGDPPYIVEQYAGSPGKDYRWFYAELDESDAVIGIYPPSMDGP
jgi:hypothetical protein